MQKLKEMRRRNGLTQKEIAKLLGINKNSYAKYEQGLRCPRLDMLKKLAEILHCTVGDII
jgi:transcriptional regulator with XRE-family HTH domain|nr:MAG TPA: helix-turn-helix domain protein [Caudoviricetes sp.]